MKAYENRVFQTNKDLHIRRYFAMFRVLFHARVAKINSHDFFPELLIVIIDDVHTLSDSFSFISEQYSEL